MREERFVRMESRLDFAARLRSVCSMGLFVVLLLTRIRSPRMKLLVSNDIDTKTLRMYVQLLLVEESLGQKPTTMRAPLV
jgi:hypothetical protein